MSFGFELCFSQAESRHLFSIEENTLFLTSADLRLPQTITQNTHHSGPAIVIKAILWKKLSIWWLKAFYILLQLKEIISYLLIHWPLKKLFWIKAISAPIFIHQEYIDGHKGSSHMQHPMCSPGHRWGHCGSRKSWKRGTIHNLLQRSINTKAIFLHWEEMCILCINWALHSKICKY